MTSVSYIDDKKSSLRKQASERRAQLAAECGAANEGSRAGLLCFADSLISRFAPKIVAGYWPVRSEINPLPLLSALEDRGARLCLPITGHACEPLSFHYWKFGSKLDTGRYGIQQPFPKAEQLYPDLICVPLLAFDGSLQRLGYGGGFYDRTLAHLRMKNHEVVAVGLAYRGQQIDRLVTGPYDEPLDNILTPEGWMVGQK